MKTVTKLDPRVTELVINGGQCRHRDEHRRVSRSLRDILLMRVSHRDTILNDNRIST